MAHDYSFDDFSYTIARGDDRKIDFLVDLDGVAQNITGWSIRFTARTDKPAGTVTDDTAAIMRYSTSGGGVTITNAAAGACRVTINKTDTYGLGATDTTLLCDLQAVDGSGNVVTLATGTLIVKPEITRATT